jgi:ABC-2 type transport system permease protein
MAMREAALYLVTRTFRNRARRLLSQLRNPRYVLALLAGLAYLSFIFLGGRHDRATPAPAILLESGGTLLLAFLVLKWWLFGADRQALAFTPAELQFLFPAPVSRAALLAYKLARGQLLIMLNVLIWSLLLRAGADSPPGRLFHAGSLWLFFSTVSLHRLGVALTRDSMLVHGRPGLRRAALPVILVGLVVIAAWITMRGFYPVSSHPFEVLRELLDAPPLAWALWPFRLPLLPFGAESAADWFPRALVALGVLALHLVWVLRADQAFEDAAVEASARRAARLERWRGGPAGVRTFEPTRRRWIPLGRTVHPALAITWKNLARMARTASTGFLLLMALFFGGSLVLGLVTADEDPLILAMAGTFALSWGGILLLFGPLWIRADLRGDLDHLATLRTWPLVGRVVMAGQVLGSAIVLTLLELLLGAIGVVALAGTTPLPIPDLPWGALLLAAIPGLGLVNLLAVELQNAAAILFPSWVRVEIRPGGIEAMGQQMLTAGLSLVVLLLLLAGPAVLAFLAWTLGAYQLGRWALLPAYLALLLALAVEAALLVLWLGARFDELDAVAELA